MANEANPVIGGYPDLADAYDSLGNLRSCWGQSTEKVLEKITLAKSTRSVADIGCGTGHALLSLAERTSPDVSFIGVEPAVQMRLRAANRTKHLPNVRILEGAFEGIPLADRSIDYLYSIYAFHWTVDPAKSAQEVHRVLASNGSMDIVFVGPDNGMEFNRVTTPIMRRYMGRAYMLAAGKMQRQISRDTALELFQRWFPRERLIVDESHETYYDSLDGHWAWRVRIEGHFSKIPTEKRRQFDSEVREALQGLATDRGIPYTVHQLHVKLRH